jgi:hypothetical protein
MLVNWTRRYSQPVSLPLRREHTFLDTLLFKAPLTLWYSRACQGLMFPVSTHGVIIVVVVVVFSVHDSVRSLCKGMSDETVVSVFLGESRLQLCSRLK